MMISPGRSDSGLMAPCSCGAPDGASCAATRANIITHGTHTAIDRRWRVMTTMLPRARPGRRYITVRGNRAPGADVEMGKLEGLRSRCRSRTWRFGTLYNGGAGCGLPGLPSWLVL